MTHNFDTIMQHAKTLQQTLPKPENCNNVYDEMISQHSHTLIQKIINILSNTPDTEISEIHLKGLLESNWFFIKGTALCYTALPNHKLTQLIVDIACALNHDDTSTFSLLMPGVSAEATNPQKYQNLETLYKSPDDFIRLFNTFILSRDGNALIPISLLSTENILKENTLPNPYFDAFHDDYHELTEEEKKAYSVLDDSEINRLKNHSPLTQQLFDAKESYQSLQHDNATLMGQLHLLLNGLYFNSVNLAGEEALSGSSIYTQSQAFYQFYDALNETERTKLPFDLRYQLEYLKAIFEGKKHFFTPETFRKMISDAAEFYAKHHRFLTKTTLNKLLATKKEMLLKSEKKEGNAIPQVRKISEYETCFATRFNKIKEAMKGHDLLLSSIGLSNETKQKKISQASDAYNQALNNLSTSRSYQGTDRLPITQDILDKTETKIVFSDIEKMISIISQLQHEDVFTIFSNEATRSSFFRQIEALDQFYFIMLELSEERLTPLFKALGKASLSELLLFRHDEFIQYFQAVPEEKQDILIDAININHQDDQKMTLLMNAIKYGNHALARLLIQKHANLNLTDRYLDTALHTAIIFKHLDLALAIIQAGADLDQVNIAGRTALLIAVEKGFQDVAVALIQKGANLLKKTPIEGHTALMIAIDNKSLSIAHEIIQHSTPEMLRDDAQKMALIYAIAFGYSDLAIELIEAGVDLTQTNKGGETALIMAIKDKRPSIAHEIIQHSTPEMLRDDAQKMALLYAIDLGYSKLAITLIEKGVDLTQTNKDGDTALIFAMRNYERDIADTLLKHTVNFDRSNKAANNPLFTAITFGYSDLAIEIMTKGADLNQTNKNGETALIFAIRNNQLEIAHNLIKHNAKLDKSNKGAKIPLFIAIQLGYDTIAYALIEQGANPHVKDETHNSALILAVKKGLTDIALTLIQKSACLSDINDENETPLLLAIEKGDQTVALALIEKGAMLNYPNKYSDTPLILAISEKLPKVAFALLKQNAKLNCTNIDGDTALFYAIDKGFPELAIALIKKGALMNETDLGRNTPLMLAIQKKDTITARFLIKQGADTCQVNRKGETALSLAKTYFLPEICRLITHETKSKLDVTQGQTFFSLADASSEEQAVFEHSMSNPRS